MLALCGLERLGLVGRVGQSSRTDLLAQPN